MLNIPIGPVLVPLRIGKTEGIASVSSVISPCKISSITSSKVTIPITMQFSVGLFPSCMHFMAAVGSSVTRAKWHLPSLNIASISSNPKSGLTKKGIRIGRFSTGTLSSALTRISDLISKYPIMCCLSLLLNTGILENPLNKIFSNVFLSNRVESEIMKTCFVFIIESATFNFANFNIPVIMLISYILKPILLFSSESVPSVSDCGDNLS
mmetsp:Transcript_24256/g.23314  ORF Transcript_24256/g.23314 Transcript_24256/m.23314 type:complete len:210 (-) Transcript_24256:741-1370(-)